MVDPLGDFHAPVCASVVLRHARRWSARRSAYFAACRATLRVRADVIVPCPPTDGAAVLLIDTDSISHSAKKEAERSPFNPAR